MTEALALAVKLAVSMLLLEARPLRLPLLEEEMLGVVDREETTGVLHQQRQQLGEEAIAAGRVVWCHPCTDRWRIAATLVRLDCTARCEK